MGRPEPSHAWQHLHGLGTSSARAGERAGRGVIIRERMATGAGMSRSGLESQGWGWRHQYALYPIPFPQSDPLTQINSGLHPSYHWRRSELIHSRCWGLPKATSPYPMETSSIQNSPECSGACFSTAALLHGNVVRIGLYIFGTLQLLHHFCNAFAQQKHALS